ncbi:MAG: sarcosine oxidase subunit delta [Acetobacteraceae bacterium]
MIIPCPYCGERGHEEFSYLGDAAPYANGRPDPDAADAFHAYVHLRENPAGPLDELWQHVGGCRAWLVVRRDVRTHAILGARAAQ